MIQSSPGLIIPTLTSSKHIEGRDIQLVDHNGKFLILKTSAHSLEKEFENMKVFDSPFIGKVIRQVSSKSYLIEYYSGGNIRSDQPMEVNRLKNIFRQMVQAVQVIHCRGFVHLDIRINNFVLDQDQGVKLIDFEHSTNVNCENIEETLGSDKYNAPERNFNQYSGYKADIFSLGVVLFRLLTGEYPFPAACLSSSRYKLFRQSKQAYWERMMTHLTKIYRNVKLDEDAIDLINWMLSENPQDRPCIDEVMKHNFLCNE
jgi:serine/threonine protein kinase